MNSSKIIPERSTDRDRRRVLKMIPALAIAPSSGSLGASRGEDDRRLAAVLLEVFAQPDTARMIGAAFLEQRPEEASFAALMGRLKVDLDLPAWYRGGAGKAELHDRLQTRAGVDYSRDEGVEVAGCYLSVTELRLYALSTFT